MFGGRMRYAPTPGTCIRYVHSAPFGGVRGAYAVAPRGFAAQGFAAQGFALGYGPPGLQPGRVRPIRALRPVGLLGRVPVRPVGAPDHSPGRNPGRSGYVHSPRWGVEVLGPCGPLVCWCGPVGPNDRTRVGAYCIRPTKRAPTGPNGWTPGMFIHPLRDVWWGVCNTPLHGYVNPQTPYRTTTFSVSCPTLMM